MSTNPTKEHREQARSIAKRYTREGTGYADRLYQLACAIEQALSSRDTEVREVLEELATRVPDGLCWCPDAGALFDGEVIHGIDCQRTQTLYAKLQPLPSENPGDTVRE